MKLDTLTEARELAQEKWREYKDASKVSSSKLYKDATKLYYQIKRGRKIIDITKVIQAGGVHKNFHPKLAIAKASSRIVRCYYNTTGKIGYLNTKHNNGYSWYKELSDDVIIENCLPPLPIGMSRMELQAPVPIIPPKHLPTNLTNDYYILWEVDEWEMVAPTDPYLLKRLTKNHFIVLAGWDLTEVEKSVMNANL